MVTIVLLNEAWICATPEAMFFFSLPFFAISPPEFMDRRRPCPGPSTLYARPYFFSIPFFLPLPAIEDFLGPFRVLAFVRVLCPLAGSDFLCLRPRYLRRSPSTV